MNYAILTDGMQLKDNGLEMDLIAVLQMMIVVVEMLYGLEIVMVPYQMQHSINMTHLY